MNREEAIANLNMISVAFVDPVTKEQRKLIDDTFDMAIKALEQEPCDNAVSRQAVLDLAKKGVLISNGNYESVCKAINELPSVNPQPCEDAISRQAVQDYIANYLSQYLYNDVREAVEVIDEYIGELPSVNSTKTGHWILSDDGLYRPICDKCGAHPWKGYIPTVEEATEVFKYCPNCGCRMVEPQERSDKE